jgi:hypothetical protein
LAVCRGRMALFQPFPGIRDAQVGLDHGVGHPRSFEPSLLPAAED